MSSGELSRHLAGAMQVGDRTRALLKQRLGPEDWAHYSTGNWSPKMSEIVRKTMAEARAQLESERAEKRKKDEEIQNRGL